MVDGLRTIHLVTNDEALLASTRAAAAGLEGWELCHRGSVRELSDEPPSAGDAVLLDSWQKDENVYETCRRLAGVMRCRTYIVVETANAFAAPIAHFCGATGALPRPLTGEALREAFEFANPRAALPSDRRVETPVRELPQDFLEDLLGGGSKTLINAVTDPETGLFNFDFLKFKLDEEFKRGQRFQSPLSCVRLGFEGQADEELLQQLAAIFLQASRDTDILGRFDQSSFLFLLPDTGPDGAAIMARRISALAEEQGLRDLVGDALTIAVGISTSPHATIQVRDDLFGQACEAYEAALREGGGVVLAG